MNKIYPSIEPCGTPDFKKARNAINGYLFLIGIHSIQDWTVTTRHGVTRKRRTKRLKDTGYLFRKYIQLIGVC